MLETSGCLNRLLLFVLAVQLYCRSCDTNWAAAAVALAGAVSGPRGAWGGARWVEGPVPADAFA